VLAHCRRWACLGPGQPAGAGCHLAETHGCPGAHARHPGPSAVEAVQKYQSRQEQISGTLQHCNRLLYCDSLRATLVLMLVIQVPVLREGVGTRA
jgi:hypothetical protein